MLFAKGVAAVASAGLLAIGAVIALGSSATAETKAKTIVVPDGLTASAAASFVHEPLFVNLGPVPRDVQVGTPQTVFQYVHAGSPTGALVANMPLQFSVLDGPNAGQSGMLHTDANGQAIWKYSTTGAAPTVGGKDTVAAWIDLNDNGKWDQGEPNNINPFFVVPVSQINSSVACDGRASTIVSDRGGAVVRGTGGPDVVSVFGDNARVYLGDGDDVVCAYGKNTTVYGDGGNDRILVQGANATVYGGDGDDYIWAPNGNNVIYGGGGNDTVITGDGNNTVWGGEGDDRLFTGNGISKLSGDAGNDTLTSTGSAGTYWGGSGDDQFTIAGRTWRS